MKIRHNKPLQRTVSHVTLVAKVKVVPCAPAAELYRLCAKEIKKDCEAQNVCR
jgi:hypothetical protein